MPPEKPKPKIQLPALRQPPLHLHLAVKFQIARIQARMQFCTDIGQAAGDILMALDGIEALHLPGIDAKVMQQLKRPIETIAAAMDKSRVKGINDRIHTATMLSAEDASAALGILLNQVDTAAASVIDNHNYFQTRFKSAGATAVTLQHTLSYQQRAGMAAAGQHLRAFSEFIKNEQETFIQTQESDYAALLKAMKARGGRS